MASRDGLTLPKGNGYDPGEGTTDNPNQSSYWSRIVREAVEGEA